MTTTMTTEAKTAHKPCDCGCDCGCGKAECCELECLVQPRFFCGQLLADQDLTALVDWIKNKTGLARFRHGWGIVCGLDVHCGPGGSVFVSPGYAMDCCGRDIVLCKEATFGLKDCWQRPPSPCSELTTVQPTPPKETPPDVDFGVFKVPRAEVQVFDVMVRYSESQSDARRALARGGCGGVAGCEYTRIHESYEIYCRPGNECEDPNDRYAMEWQKKYQAERDQILKELPDPGDSPDVKLQRIAECVKRFPPSTFCFVRERLCELQYQQNRPQNFDSDLSFWILQDWRNGCFRNLCKGCSPDTGVLLAQVWVWMRKDSRNEVFTTLFVNAYPPFRRLLTQETWPAHTGEINLAPFIWAQADSAAAALQKLGFNVQSQQVEISKVPQLLREECLMVNPATTRNLVIYQYSDYCHQRVVCFGTGTRGAAPPPEPPPQPSDPTPTPPTGPGGTQPAPATPPIEPPPRGGGRTTRTR